MDVAVDGPGQAMEKGEGGNYFSLDRKIVPAIQHSELRLACISNDIAAVKAIIKGGIRVNQPLREEWTVLMFALRCAHPEMVSCLLDMGANLNYQCPTNMFTPVMALASTRNANCDDIVQCLLTIAQAPEHVKRNLDLNAANTRNDTALMIATINNHKEIVTWLSSHGASNSCYNKDGLTALDIAASTGRGDICAAIIKNSHDIDLFASNDEGLTVCEVAKNSGRSQIAGILYEIQTSEIRPHMCDEILEELECIFEADMRPGQSPIVYRSEENSILNHLGHSGLRKYVPLFQNYKIDFEALLTLNQEKLKAMGVKEIGARLTILESVYNANCQEWTMSKCLPKLHQDPIPYGKKGYSSSVDDPDTFIYRNSNAIAYQKNIARQLVIIAGCLQHMKNQMANFTSDSSSTVIKTSCSSKIEVMKTQLRKLGTYMKTIRATETKTRSVLQLHPGRYADGRFIHEDEVLPCDLDKNDKNMKWKQLAMWAFHIVSYFLLNAN